MSTTVFVDRLDGGVPVMDGGSLESGVFKVFTEDEEGANSNTAQEEWVLFWALSVLSVGGPYYMYGEEKRARIANRR